MNTIKSIIAKIKNFIIAHKIWSVVILVVVIFIGYKIFGSTAAAQVRYVTATVEKGTIISSVTGTGQVEASSSIDLKSKISGTITRVNIKPGQFVSRGQTLFSVDAVDAERALRDASLNLQMAQNDLKTAERSYENTRASQELNLKNLLFALNSSVAAIPDSSNFNTNIITLSGSYNSSVQGRYTLEVYSCQNGVCISYSGLESGTFTINTNVAQPIGSRGLYATFTSLPRAGEKWYIDAPSPSSNSYASNKKAYEDAQISISEAIENAKENVTTRELALTQRQNALIDAKQLLSNYYVSAPFDGVIASVLGKAGDIATGTLGTIITKSKLATITLNEVDVSKIDLGQKVTLTFDAVDGLTITGEVAEMDGVGTVSQGVVSYALKISFDTDDPRIKPGMSVSAAIITATKQDILIVPSSAIKTNANGSYVEMFSTPIVTLPVTAGSQGFTSQTKPIEVPVEIGISNDTQTEITSGLKEGDQVVSRIITSTATKATTTAPSLFGSPGGGNRGGGARTGAVTR